MSSRAARDSRELELRLLGQIEAAANGQPLAIRGQRQRALLALLLREPGRTVSIDHLSDELWHGKPPPEATRTLRTYVSRLRTVLGHDAIATRASGYAIEIEADQVDVHRFERLLRQGREALARGAAGLAAERLHAALALWRGVALGDVADDGVLALEARRLEELRVVCLEERIDADLALGRHIELVAELEELVTERPFRERLWRQLVLALVRSERQADALAAYRRARNVLREELGLEPSVELRELERAVLRQEIDPVEHPDKRHNIPAGTTSFVGRKADLSHVEALLRDHRLLTLTGIGGAGKTRLALEVASRQRGAWRNGVWLVDLTAVAGPEQITGLVCATLAASEGREMTTEEALLANLARSEFLLILDNCEHVLDACGRLAEAVLRRCPDVRLLATSRLPLGLTGEFEYEVEPLPIPADTGSAHDIERSPSVRLFLDRGRAVRRDLAATDDGLAIVAQICRELDGLPLAIELAAARTKALSLSEIAARLHDRFRFLRAWRRIADPRHQTLRATMDWSFDLLAVEEQALLRGLSVFAAGFTLDAVADVCLQGNDESAVELLSRLVDASLVRRDERDERRYRLLETVRQYAAERLDGAPTHEQQTVRRRHAQHYLDIADSANLSVESLGRGPQRHELVLPEQHNLRAAMNWAADEDVELGVRLAVSLENFWITHDPREGARRLESLLNRAAGIDPLLRARAVRDYAGCRDVAGDSAGARAAYEQSRELFRQIGDLDGMALVTHRLGANARFENDLERARQHWQDALESFRRTGNRIGELQSLGALGLHEVKHGDEGSGRAMLATSMEMAREAGWVWWEAGYLQELAEVALEAGSYAEAEKLAREFLPLAQRMDSRQDILFGLAILARTAAERGDRERALDLWAAIEAVEDGPARFGQFDRQRYAAFMPRGPRPDPLPLDRAIVMALST
jgi:predicted ATPase/DNA-binding SARP family transcriptional activator